MLNYLVKKLKDAIACAREAEKYEAASAGLWAIAQNNCYYSLALLADYPAASKRKQKEYLSCVAANQKKMKNWAQRARINLQHKYDLVEAEKARVLGKKWEAMKLYDLAIKGAKEQGYIQEEALANELAAKFYFGLEMLHREEVAKTYMTEAYHAYLIWGAVAKIRDLESRYPQFLSPLQARETVKLQTTRTTSSTANHSAALDYATVMKASLAISGEIVLPSLLDKLMKIAIENAGARKGFLILASCGKLRVEAEASVDSEDAAEKPSIPVRVETRAIASEELPVRLINYVERTKDNVLLNDASSEGLFTADTYITKNQVKSVLCTPIIKGGKLIGILYLENNLTSGAFTRDRLEILKILSAQAAISLENAQLIAYLEQKVEERTRELNEKNARLLHEIEERQLTEERFRAIFESSDDSIGVWDKDYNCLYANFTMLNTLGTTRDEAIGKNIRLVLGHLTELPLWISRLEQVFQTPQSLHVEDIIRVSVNLASDRNFHWESTLSPIKDSAGNVFAVGVVSRNVTERNEKDAALRQSEAHYRAVVEDQTELICRFLADGTFTFVNDAYCRYFNIQRDEVIGHSFMPVIPSEDQLKIKQSLASLNADNPIAIVEHRVLLGGHQRWQQWTNRAIFDEQSNFIEFQAVGSDITKRKRAEEALARSNARYQNLATNIPGMIYQFMLHPDGSMTLPYVSPGCRAIYGVSPEEAMQNAAVIFDLMHPDDLASINESMAVSASTLEPWHCVSRIIVQGKIKWVQGNSRPERCADGSILWDGLVVDISDRKRSEEVLQQAKETADAASRAKGEFLSKMSHELRTPLNAILGFTQVLNRDSSLTPQQREYLGIISRAGEHLLALINDVLEMSKIEAGRIELNETTFDLYRLLDSLEEMFQLKAESKSLQLIFDRTRDLPQYIKTDESKLRQVLINLLGNAIKFTEVGGVALRVGTQEQLSGLNFLASVEPEAWNLEPDTYLMFEVADTGPGIAREELDTLFDPFVQTETGRKSHSGTGLGLPISRQFVQLMGGDIAVSSTVGKETIVKFDIRIIPVDAAEVPTSQPTRRVIGLEPNQDRYRILVVEDKWESRLLLVNLLVPLGFEVREAVNGLEAIATNSSWEPHLIWMDMQMPLMDGYEATKHIKATPQGQRTVIIALTASAFEENRAMVLEAGCDDFVSKPFRAEVIYEKMAEYLKVRYMYEEPDVRQLPLASRPEKSASSEPSYEALARMSAQWIAQLQQAATELDDALIGQLIEQIPESDAPLARTLADLANQLRFDKINYLIQLASQ